MRRCRVCVLRVFGKRRSRQVREYEEESIGPGGSRELLGAQGRHLMPELHLFLTSSSSLRHTSICVCHTRRLVVSMASTKCEDAAPLATARTTCRHPAKALQRPHWIRTTWSNSPFLRATTCCAGRSHDSRRCSLLRRRRARASRDGAERRELSWRCEEHVLDADKRDRTHTRLRRFGQDKSHRSRSRCGRPVEAHDETARKESRAVQGAVLIDGWRRCWLLHDATAAKRLSRSNVCHQRQRFQLSTLG